MTTFELNCTTCAFSTVIEGDLTTVYDQVEDHRTDVEWKPGAHFVVAWCLT